MIIDLFRDMLTRNKKNRDESIRFQSENVTWKGYEAEKLMAMIYEIEGFDGKKVEWIELLEKIILVLEPYYEKVELIQHTSHNDNNMILMLSSRQMNTFNNALSAISYGDVWSAIREWSDFIHNYGKYKNHCFSQLETYIIYVLALQIVRLLY